MSSRLFRCSFRYVFLFCGPGVIEKFNIRRMEYFEPSRLQNQLILSIAFQKNNFFLTDSIASTAPKTSQNIPANQNALTNCRDNELSLREVDTDIIWPCNPAKKIAYRRINKLRRQSLNCSQWQQGSGILPLSVDARPKSPSFSPWFACHLGLVTSINWSQPFECMMSTCSYTGRATSRCRWFYLEVTLFCWMWFGVRHVVNSSWWSNNH